MTKFSIEYNPYLKALDAVFNDIKKYIPEIHMGNEEGEDISDIYEESKNGIFEVNVIAAMSSGKSTLINSLLHTELLPAENRACTANVVRIFQNNHMDKYEAECYGEDDQTVVRPRSVVTSDLLQEYNSDEEVAYIDIEGSIPTIPGDKIRLCLRDTPGPNNSGNVNYERLIRSIIKQTNTVVLYVMSATQIELNDDRLLLKEIAEEMKRAGKQSRDRFIFVINKCDWLDVDSGETVDKVLGDVAEYLEGLGISDPILIPTSARLALLIRKDEKGEELSRREKRELICQIEDFAENELLHFEEYATLTPAVREKLQNEIELYYTEEEPWEKEALIHTGIPAVEETICEYIDKYVYPMKINGAIKAIKTILDQLDIKVDFDESIFDDEDKLTLLREQIANVQKKQELQDDGEETRRRFGVEVGDVIQNDQEEARKIFGVEVGRNTENSKNEKIGAEVGGIIYGNVSNASTIYGTDKFATPRGHGFAAEQANHLYDKITNADFFGKNKVRMVGEDIDPQTGRIIKNGADRVVNGTNIQTKYCKTGGKCISECFDNGKFRYLNSDGTPMQVEVPSDKYDAAVQAMENRIKNGEVPGVTDPKEAKNIVRKGHFTYEQAKNIAKAGTVESITFDAVNGAIIATSAFGISTVLSFATSVWNGEEFDVAIKNATYTGLKVGGTTFITAVLSSQLSKAGLNSALVGSSEAIVSIMGPKASAMLVNAFRSGTNIYGAAAMKSAAKMLRGNAITGAVSVMVLSSVDVMNIFRGRISGKQLFKNVANTASTVAGGTAGWVGGATAGAALRSAVPIIGTAIGGIVGGVIGSFAGGAASSKVSNTVLGAFIEDDAEEMTEIIEKVFQEMAVDYLLNQKEAENIVDELKGELSGGTLKDMFASSDRKKFARNLIVDHVEKEVKKRKKIKMPSDGEMQKSLREVLEEMSVTMELPMQTT